MLRAYLDGYSADTFVSQNRSTFRYAYNQSSPIYVHVLTAASPGQQDRLAGSLSFSYYYFYPWNGCSNQQLHYSTSEDDEYLFNYIACDFAVHEGDWEHVTVEVCGDLSKVLTVTYGEHDFSQRTQCWTSDRANLSSTQGTGASNWDYWDHYTSNYSTALVPADRIGSCQFRPNTTHPLGFIGLNSHATYPRISHEYLTRQTLDVSGIISNLEAINLVDRVLPDLTKPLVPLPGNVIPLLEMEDEAISSRMAQVLNGSADALRDPQVPLWNYFSGSWGGVGGMSGFERIHSPLCVSQDQTSVFECPEELVWTQILDLILGVSESNRDAIAKLSHDFEDLLTLGGPRGPIMKTYYNNSETMSFPVVLGAAIVCPTPTKLKSGYHVSKYQEGRDRASAGFGFAAIAVASFSFAFLILAFFCLRSRRHYHDTLFPLNRQTSGSNTKKLFKSSLLFRFVNIPMLGLGSIVIYVCGLGVMIPGILITLNVLKITIPMVHISSSLHSTLFALIGLSITFNSIALVMGLFLRFGLTAIRYELNGGHSGRWGKLVLGKKIRIFSQVILLLVCVSAFFTAILFGGSIVIVVFRYVIIVSCGTIQSKDLGLCINLSQFGGNDICGEDITTFCSSWTNSRVWIFGVGSGLCLIGNILLLISTSQNEETIHWIQLYESRYMVIHQDTIKLWKQKYFTEKWWQISKVHNELHKLQEKVDMFEHRRLPVPQVVRQPTVGARFSQMFQNFSRNVRHRLTGRSNSESVTPLTPSAPVAMDEEYLTLEAQRLRRHSSTSTPLTVVSDVSSAIWENDTEAPNGPSSKEYQKATPHSPQNSKKSEKSKHGPPVKMAFAQNPWLGSSFDSSSSESRIAMNAANVNPGESFSQRKINKPVPLLRFLESSQESDEIPLIEDEESSV